jgi:hypothetical protein
MTAMIEKAKTFLDSLDLKKSFAKDKILVKPLPAIETQTKLF